MSKLNTAQPASGQPPRFHRLRGLTRRVVAGADLLAAAKRVDIARMMICWADLKRT